MNKVEKRMDTTFKICEEMWLYLLLFLPLVIWGQSEGQKGVVFGRIMNGTRDSSAVAEQQVTLYQYVDKQKVEDFQIHTVTDASGRFIFEGLDVVERFAYYPVTVYEGVEYSGVVASPVPSALEQQSDILVFEKTLSDSAISTIMHHLIVEPGEGVLVVREVLLFANRDNRTYFGNVQTTSGKNIVLRMETPVNAAELQVGGDLMSCCAVINGNQIFDTMEFRPGIRQIILSYVLPYKGSEVNLTKKIEHPTENLDIFLLGSVLSKITIKNAEKESEIVSMDQFEKVEPFQIRGEKYNRYEVGDLERGSIFSLMISDLPTPPGDFRWLALVILILIIIVSYLSHWRWVQKRRHRELEKKEETSQQLNSESDEPTR